MTAVVIPANHRELSTKDAIKDMKHATVAVLLETAREIVEEQCEDSKVLDPTVEAKIAKFDIEEISLGRVLGRGGFCVVREIEKIKTQTSKEYAKSLESKTLKGSFLSRMMMKRSRGKPESERQHSVKDFRSNSGLELESVDPNGVKMSECSIDFKYCRDFVAARSKQSRKSGRYVIKQIALDLKQSDKITFMKGTVDMAMEAKFLSALDHPNIIGLTGVGALGPYSDAYFLVLEKLNETLSRKIKNWMNIDRQCKGITGVFTGSKRKEENLYRHQIEAAYDIACGGAYLHEKNIIFRDLVSQYCYRSAGAGAAGLS